MRSFELLPAIDLLDGRCVRLRQGRYQDVTVYDADPAALATRFAAHPLRFLHLVDLDGARTGRPGNRQAVCAILDALHKIPIELGGGIRSLESIETWLELGVARVILGTAALREPALVLDAARRFPGRIGVSIDAREGRVAVAGWLENSETDALTLARRFEDAGVAALIHTDIARDGMGSGPNLEASVALARAVKLPVIASGGVGSLEHVRAAAACDELHGLIVGRALLDGAFTLGEALEAACC